MISSMLRAIRGPRSRSMLCILIWLPGCFRPEPEPLRVGLLVWPAYEMGFLARDLGYYDGHAIELVEFHSPAITMRAYDTGAVDVVAMTTHYMLQFGARDRGQRAVLVTNVSTGADAVLARPPIARLSDLAGRRIGVERSVQRAYMLHRALEEGGLVQDDIEIVSVDVADGPDYYSRGLVDAVVTYEPYRTQIKKLGARELLSSRDMPNEIMDVLFTHEAVIADRKAELAALVDGWFKAVDAFESNPQLYARDLAAREGLSPEEFMSTFDHISLVDREGNKRLMGPDVEEMKQMLESVAAVLQRTGFLDTDLDYESMLEPQFVRAVRDPS